MKLGVKTIVVIVVIWVVLVNLILINRTKTKPKEPTQPPQPPQPQPQEKLLHTNNHQSFEQQPIPTTKESAAITPPVEGQQQQQQQQVITLSTNNGSSTDLTRPKELQQQQQQTKPEQKKKVRIAIVTYHLGAANDIKSTTWPNKKQYAERNGYTLINANEDCPEFAQFVTENSRKTGQLGKVSYFLKFYAILLTMAKDFDWIMWCDSDSIFLNQSKLLEQYIDDRFDMVVTAGPPNNAKWSRVINAGHFLVRNSPFGQKIMNQLWQMRNVPCEPQIVFNGWLSLCHGSNYWERDQGAMMHLLELNYSYQCHVKYVGFREFNSEFPWWGEGDLLVHMPGSSTTKRKQIFSQFLRSADFNTGTVKEKIYQEINPDHAADMDAIYGPHNEPCKTQLALD